MRIAILAAIDRPDAATGQVFNIGEAGSYSMRAWMRLIVAAAGHDADLMRVADDLLPADLRLTRTMSQHFVVSSAKAMSLLDWRPMATAAAVASSVQWHLENPPADRDAPDFAADDAALASVR
jgi:nucleoside-diphosphate-sugar epimerase